MAQRIAADSPQSVAIVGDRRIGKSSVLSYISHQTVAESYLEDPGQTLFLLMDFQQERRLTTETFIQSVCRHLGEKLGDRIPPGTVDYDGLVSVVEELERSGFRLILLLDEFDRVTRSSSFDADFFAFLRALGGHRNVAFVTSSSRDLQELCHTQEIADSPFFNIFSTVQLGPLKEAEARELICLPSKDTPFPLDDHTDFILELGGLWPFFLQMAGSAVFEVSFEEDRFDAGLVRARFLEEAQPHFQFFWEQFDPVTRALCNDVACEREIDRSRVEYVDLQRRGIVIGENRIFSCLFADHVREMYAREVGDGPLEVQASRARSLEGELEKARETQMNLLPQGAPKTEGLEIAAHLEPASQVGGDFYTYLWLDELCTQLAIVAVDVMGHGMQGAVTALRFSETLRYEARGRSVPADILEGLNRSLHGVLEQGSFVCCCIVVLDLRERWAEVGTGGYHPPLHFRASEDHVVQPELGNLPLGIRPDTVYQSTGFPLHKGDMLLLYSDGVFEATDDRGDVYGEDRLKDMLLVGAREDAGASSLLERVLWDVNRYSASAGRTDDITAICVRVTD